MPRIMRPGDKSSNVEKVEVVEGAMSTLYGSGAIGGVVNIITKKNKEPYWFNVSSQYDDPISNTASIVFHYINQQKK